MKFFKKIAEKVERDKLEMDDKFTEAIDNARQTGSLREHKGEPMKGKDTK